MLSIFVIDVFHLTNIYGLLSQRAATKSPILIASSDVVVSSTCPGSCRTVSSLSVSLRGNVVVSSTYPGSAEQCHLYLCHSGVMCCGRVHCPSRACRAELAVCERRDVFHINTCPTPTGITELVPGICIGLKVSISFGASATSSTVTVKYVSFESVCSNPHR